MCDVTSKVRNRILQRISDITVLCACLAASAPPDMYINIYGICNTVSFKRDGSERWLNKQIGMLVSEVFTWLQVNHSLRFYAVFQRYKEQAQGKRRVLSLRKRPVSAIPQSASLTLSKRAASVPPTPADMQQQVYVANHKTTPHTTNIIATAHS